MVSKAYKAAVKRTPKDIRQYVTKSLEIVAEIMMILDKKKMKPSDLAKTLDKQESEISKWLTGLHNLTMKSITKMESELNTDIIVPKSKLDKKQAIIRKLNVKLKELMDIIVKLEERIKQLEDSQSIVITAEIIASNGANTIASATPKQVKDEEEKEESRIPVFDPVNTAAPNPFEFELELESR